MTISLQATRDFELEIDKLTLATSQQTLAHRVDRLLESACPAYSWWMAERGYAWDVPFAADTDRHECVLGVCAPLKDDGLFTPLYYYTPHNNDALDYDTEVQGAQPFLRHSYGESHRFYETVNTVGNELTAESVRARRDGLCSCGCGMTYDDDGNLVTVDPF